MAGYLVYRSTHTDRLKLPYDIGGVLASGGSASAAKAAAIGYVTRFVGPKNAAMLDSWETIQLSSSDFSGAAEGTIFQGATVLPGSMLIGGGMTV